MPSPFRKDQLSPAMQERYGLDRGHAARNSVIALIIAAFVGILIFVTYSLSQQSIQFRLLSWSDLSAERVDVTFELRKPADVAALCIVRAQDRNRIDVGYAEVVIPAGDEYNQVTYSLRTLAPAYTAELLTCVPNGDPIRVPGPQFPAGVAPPVQPWSE
ncbi:MAG: DUF4307 domain-containing protein [Candidatus Nanopelagicales bacterium]|nr:DUF4307 domain-containing protein [Candidatus Nanopelagicales bacterium]MCF8539499.1 DUF4307 domain-containing protein [Candidatus Nanopelagicales bacterium]MCF8550955.1 DUF4307 domain-containing protein [Candidatus Nanopelagicales bacterium]